MHYREHHGLQGVSDVKKTDFREAFMVGTFDSVDPSWATVSESMFPVYELDPDIWVKVTYKTGEADPT